MKRIDSALVQLLKLDPDSTSVVTHGSSGFSSTYKINTEAKDGNSLSYFMKTGSGPKFATMFEGEHAGLSALHQAVPTLCPKSYGHGKLGDSPGYFLVTDFLLLGGRAMGESFAAKMAKLHTTPAPAEYGGRFGFPVVTCCGDTKQDNSWEDNWPDFYANRRLLAILKESERKNGQDNDLRWHVEKTAQVVVPRLLGSLAVKAVPIHGDLWSGNYQVGQIAGQGPVEHLVFDPSVVYGHNEYELGIMKLFGGFSDFFKEYHKLVPKDEPEEEYEDRIRLYELYHQLNHYAIFGGSYRSGAMSILKSLCYKYGTDGRSTVSGRLMSLGV